MSFFRRAFAPFLPISVSSSAERAFALALPPSFPNACAAGFFFVIAYILAIARLDVKPFLGGSEGRCPLVPLYEAIEVAHIYAPRCPLVLLDDWQQAVLNQLSQFPGRDAEILSRFSDS